MSARDVDALAGAIGALDVEASARFAVKLGFALDLAAMEGIHRILARARGQGYQGSRLGVRHAVEAMAAATAEASGIALREVRRESFGKDCVLAVRLSNELVVGVAHVTNVPLPIGSVWPSLKPWRRDVSRNRAAAERWAAQPRKVDRITVRLLQERPANEALEPTYASLLAEVVSNPRDDAPRLMLADWLLERGDPRGELIRLEHERMAMSFDEDCPEHSARHKELLDRTRQLTLRLRNDIVGPAGAWVDGYTLRGGFIESVSMKPSQFDKHWAELTALHPVRAMTPTPASDSSLTRLAKCPALRSLACLRLQSPIDHHQRVLSLELLAASPYLDQLEALELYNVRAEPNSWRRFFAEASMSALRSIRVFQGEFPSEALLGLSENPRLISLETLSIEPSDRGRPADDELRAEAFARLGTASAFAKLDEVVLAFWRVTDAHIAAWVAGPNARSLRSIELRALAIGDATAHTIAAAPNLAGLASLDLSNNQISAEGAEAIRSSKTLASLLCCET